MFLATAAVLLAVGEAVNHTSVPAGWLPGIVLVVAVSAVCFGALGLALICLVPSVRDTTAITLGTLLPLAFLSDVFPHRWRPIPRPPAHRRRLPAQHVVHALIAAFYPDTAALGDHCTSRRIAAGGLASTPSSRASA